MRKQRFTNGVKKVLKRQYTSPEQISDIADESVINGSLWERGTGLGSLKSKGTNCTASGKYALAYGTNAHALRDYENVFASDTRFDKTNELKYAQKKEIILTVHPTDKAIYYFVDKDGNELEIPEKTTWNCRIMINLNIFHSGTKMVTWDGSFAAGNENGTVSLRGQSITKSVDDTGSAFGFSVVASTNKVRLKLTSSAPENYVFAIAYVEILEMTWNN